MDHPGVVFVVGRGREGFECELVFEIGQVQGRFGACGQEAGDEGGADEQHARRDEAADLEAVEERAACRVEQRVAGGAELV